MMHKNLSARPVIYMAGPLFSAAERSFNVFLKHQLDDVCDIYLPQQDGFLMSDLIDSGMTPQQACGAVFKNDINALHRCDCVLVLLDGRSVDEGAAVELGYAYCLGKVCISLQTDFRRLAPFGNNPMITGAISQEFQSVEKLVAWVRDWAKKFPMEKREGRRHAE